MKIIRLYTGILNALEHGSFTRQIPRDHLFGAGILFSKDSILTLESGGHTLEYNGYNHSKALTPDARIVPITHPLSGGDIIRGRITNTSPVKRQISVYLILKPITHEK